MVLDDNQIQKAVLNNHADYDKNIAYEALLSMIVNGHEYQKYLIGLSDLENKKQKKLRELYAKSTKPLAHNIIRPFYNIFTAVGGSKSFIFDKGSDRNKKAKESNLIDLLKNKSVNGSIDFFMSEIWGKRVIDSPRSTILLEVSQDGKEKYPVFVSQKFVHNWKYRGILNYEWICIFKGDYEIDKKPVKMYRLIDDAFDYSVLVNDKKEVKIIGLNETIEVNEKNGNAVVFTTLENLSSEVEAIQMSSKISNDMTNKVSLLDAVIELFENHLLDDGVKRIFKFLHGYPEYNRISDNVCHACGGLGHDNFGTTCRACGGTGAKKKDVSDENSIQLPDDNDTPFVLPANYSAYIAPSIETWQQMNIDLLNNKEDIMFTIWGASIVADTNKQYSTAVGRILDVKPINDVLEQYSKIAQQIDKYITDKQAKFYFPDDFKESLVLYGNFYLTNTPDQLIEKYQNLLKDGASYQDLDRAMVQYLHTIYAKEPMRLKISLKDLEYEYYRHDTIEIVQTYLIPELLKNRKIYYQLFRKSIPDSKFLAYNSIDDFNVDLDKFIDQFAIEPIEQTIIEN